MTGLRIDKKAPQWIAIAAVPVCFLACTNTSQTVLTSANAYAFAESRYEDACVSVDGPPRPDCQAMRAILLGWKRRLKEASDAISRGGKLPLQLEALRAPEKEARTWLTR